MSTKARLLALVATVVAALLAAPYARGIHVDAGIFSVLPNDVPAVTAWRDALTRFDALDVLLVGLEEPGSSLSVEGLRRVDAVTRSLEARKEDGVLAVRSVTNVATLREGASGEVDSGALIAALPDGPAALDALKQRIAESAQVLGALVSRDFRGYAIVVRIDPRKSPLEVAALIQRTVEHERGPLAAYYHGAPFFAAVPAKHVLAELPRILAASVVLFFGILILGTRRPAVAVFVALSSAASLVLGVALLRAAGGSLSSSSAPLALGWFALAGTLFAAIGSVDRARQHGPVGESATGHSRRWPPRVRVAACAAGIIAGGIVASQARVLCTPGELFSRQDEVGRALTFFDERFGGADFLQIDFAGDLTSPAVAARLMRLSDLLEASPGLSDVRSVAQVLAFVNHGFGDVFRIPSTREALANLWFFLEGNGDVRSLVTDKRDEAMIQIRIKSLGGPDVGALGDAVRTAVGRSATNDAGAASLRLEAIGRSAGARLDPAVVKEVTAAAVAPPSPSDEQQITGQVVSRLRRILAAPDSPYPPSEEEWGRLAEALSGDEPALRARLTAAAAGMERLHAAGVDSKLVDMLVQRERDARIAVRGHMLAERLLPPNAPQALQLRVEGALADVIDPQAEGGQATVTISGFPILASAISSRSLLHVWQALAVVLALGCVLVPVRGVAAGARRVLVAATATGLTFVVCRAVGVQMDVGSAGIYVLPAVLGVLAPASGRDARSFLLAFGCAMGALFFTGAPPVTRVAVSVVTALLSVAFVAWFLEDRASLAPAAPTPLENPS